MHRWVLLLPAALGCLGLFPLGAQPITVGDARSVDSQRVPLIVLRHDRAGIEAAVAPSRGGELSGLKVRFRDQWIETIYLARDYSPREGWTGKAPLLWPATGRTLNPARVRSQQAGEAVEANVYEIGGEFYPMSGHGFARDFPWTVEKRSAEGVQLLFKDSARTRRMYPFGFHNTVQYGFTGTALEIRYRIRASSENTERMPFSIGNHITFVIPLVPGSSAADVELFSPSRQEILKDSGIPTGEVRDRSHADGVRLGGFERRVPVSLTAYSGERPWVLLRDPQGLSIRLSHSSSRIPPQPVVLFNLWGDALDGFFSPEPWVGLQNSLNLRQGLIYLEPGEHFDWRIRIEVERSGD